MLQSHGAAARAGLERLLLAGLLFALVPETALAWWDTNWQLRRKVFIDNSGQPSNLTSFPVLVRLDSTRVEYFRTRNSGQDIRFVDADDTTVLAHEIERWDEAGSSYVWVRVPQIDGGSNADYIWMYYGNPAALDGQNAAAVWDADFKMVQHLEELGGPHFDSTSTGSHSIVVDVQSQGAAAGQIARTSSFLASSTDNVDVANTAALNGAAGESLTVEAWVSSSSASNFMVAVSKEADDVAEYQLWVNTGSASFWVHQDPDGGGPGAQSARADSAVNVRNGAWHYLVGRWTASTNTADVFVNGVLVGSGSNPAVTNLTNAGPLVIGEEGDANRGGNFDGILDEIRVSKAAVPRSDDWIRAQNLSMRDSYLSFGPATCPGACSALATSESAGTLTVTSPGSFEMLFTPEAGGGIERLYDLVEDPGKSADLVGSLVDPTLSSPRGMHNYGMSVGGVFYNASRNNFEGRSHLLEATSVRTRVRQDSLLQGPAPGNLRLGGVKAYGDYSIYPSGKIAARWNRRTHAAVTFASEYVEWFVHLLANPDPLSFWTPSSQSGVNPPLAWPHPGLDDFALFQNEQTGAVTDLLMILSKDWTVANGFAGDVNNVSQAPQLPHERINMFWNDNNSVALAAGVSHNWDTLSYVKPTVFASHTDTAVTTRSGDYRVPSALATITGGPWNDLDENTGSDDFNEAEAAYLLTLDPSAGQGLRFQITGTTAAPRYTPFFKIRRWRSLAKPTSVTLDGAPLPSGAGYRAEVKPLARAHFASDLTWYSTLQDAGAVTTPDVGSGGVITNSDFAVGRYGTAARFDAAGEFITIPRDTNLDLSKGTVEFWFQPTFAHTDGVAHRLWGYSFDAGNFFFLQKEGGTAPVDGLRFRISRAGVNTDVTVASTDYSWRALDWVHFRVTWDESAPLADQVRLFVNGVEPVHTDPVSAYVSAGMPTTGSILIGADSNGNRSASGLVDEFRIYSSAAAPEALAHGGLTSDARERLYDASDNFPLAFAGVDAQGRGRYAYFGSDSKWSGLNVGLSVAGVGTGLDLAWQFWNGTSWADLESVTGFNDSTNQLTRSGNVYWTGEPTLWAPYSVNGGPELYYVRAHLVSGGSYGTTPVEGLISTDLLLLQLCHDVTATHEIVIPAPFTTAVTLAAFSATPLDGAVNLTWSTASELRNLGFHIYRATSEKGPWTRLTSSLIAGLGSSAVGQVYAYRDSGLQNGTRYYYRLDDVDASSRTTSHGPVSAIPQAAASGGNGGGSGGGRDAGKKPVAASCPAWVVQTYSALAGADAATAGLGCSRHGDPEAVSLDVTSRDARGATLELRTGGFYALHEGSGMVRVFVPGFDVPQDAEAAPLPVRRALVEAVVGRRVQLAGVRALDRVSFKGLVPSALGKPEMRVAADGTVRAMRRGARASATSFPKRELVSLLPSVFQGETKSAAVEIVPLRFDERRRELLLARRVVVRLLFTGREPGESGRGSVGRAPSRRQPPAASGEVLARLHTGAPGLYASAFEQLFPGLRRGLPVSELKLARQGAAVAFHVEPAGTFGPGSRLYFHADASPASTDFSGEVAYELIRAGDGVRMALVPALPGSAIAPAAPIVTRTFEVNRFYQPGLLEAEDVWLWEALASGAVRSKPFALAGVLGSGDAGLEVRLQGASESGAPVDHHVSVSLNGVPVGEARFAGKRSHRLSLAVPSALLRDGANELSLTNVADTGVSSLVFLDGFTVVHPQLPALLSGAFEGTWAEAGSVTLAGASGPVAVLDATPGASARWLTGFEASAGSLRFQAQAGRRYLVVSQPLEPRVAATVPATLRAAGNQADYLLVAPEAFLAAAEPLVERRRDQGLAARAVSLEQIAAEFGHGQPSAEAVRSFLAHAFHSWQHPSPRYALLLGDASYDPRNFAGTSQPAPLPALWTKTSYLWTVADPLLAAVNGEDGLPDLAIGRLPATTAPQAEALVRKLLAWEDSGQGLAGRAALVAADPDHAGDFEQDVRDVAQSFLAARSPQLLFLREHGPGLRPRIQEALDSGLSFLSYVGHGGAAVWASENVWNSWDAAGLQVQSQQPLLVTMNCLNGYFVAPSFDSLAESLLKAEGRGAIAAFSPSGLSLDGPAHQYHRALMAELTSGRHARLGDAILAAQHAYARTGLMPELLSVYHLLGDPATALR